MIEVDPSTALRAGSPQVPALTLRNDMDVVAFGAIFIAMTFR